MKQKINLSKRIFAALILYASLIQTTIVKAQYMGTCTSMDSLGSSSNVFTATNPNTKPVSVDPLTGSILFVQRNNASIFGGNSGQFRYNISTDGGATWQINQGPLNTATSDLGRYPSAVMFNPLNSTNPSDVYINFLGSNNLLSKVTTGTRKLDNTISNETTQATSNGLMLSMVKGASGEFWSVKRKTDIATNTYHIEVYKGTWNNTTKQVNWSLHTTLNPNLDLSFNGQPQWTDPSIAFDPSGQKGWVALLGDATSSTSTKNVYNPILFKTTDGGNTWSGPIALNVETMYWPNCYTRNSFLNSFNYYPTTNFEQDLAVDYLGVPHIFTTICQSNTSAAYSVFYGLNKFMADITISQNQWTVVDFGYYHVSGRGSYGIAPNNSTMDMMPQIATSVDGKKIFYTWVEDVNATNGNAPIEPKLWSIGVDLVTNNRTLRHHFGGCGANFEPIYYPHMAPFALQTPSGSHKLAIVYTPFNTALDPLAPVHFRFMDDAIYTPNLFTENYIWKNYDTVTACGSYYFGGNLLTASGNYVGVVNNPFNGCQDSMYLNLTISSQSYNTTTASACTSYTWSVDGNTYTTSGMYTFTNPLSPCNIEVLDLTIGGNLPPITAANIDACQGSVIDLNNYVTPSPTTGGIGTGFDISNPYTGASTNYTYTFVDPVSGCSSSVSASINVQTIQSASGLTVSNSTANTATISWNPVAGAAWYTLRYRPLGASTWIYSTTSSNTKTLLGLAANQTYELEIRANCNISNVGYYGSSITFTTGAACETPTNVTHSAVVGSNGTKMKLNWSSSLSGGWFNVRHREQGATNWITTSSSSTSHTMVGLTPNTTYEYQVRKKCSTNDVSNWSVVGTFTTLGNPSKPNDDDILLADQNIVQVYPNPTNGLVNLNVTMQNATELNIKVFDITGKLVIEKIEMASQGYNHIPIDLNKLADGLYTIITHNGDEKLSINRVVKKK